MEISMSAKTSLYIDRLVSYPMPPRLAARPTDARGFVIPYTVHVAPDGAPDFRKIDVRAWWEAVQERKCGLCGQRLDGVALFVGGPVAARTRDFIDAPMHPECADYALHVCPYMALPHGVYFEHFGHPAEAEFLGATGLADALSLMGDPTPPSDPGARIATFEVCHFRPVWRAMPDGRALFLHARHVYNPAWYERCDHGLVPSPLPPPPPQSSARTRKAATRA